jgi:LacI family gluconate utilization system Gnt-I transcriptional repressor
MTVSRAFRAPQRVAAATLERIQEAASELGYVGSALASQLASGRTRLIAVVLPDLRNPAFALEIQGLSDGLGDQFDLVFSGENEATDAAPRRIRSLLGYQPAALVVHGGLHDAESLELVARRGVPFIELGSLTGKGQHISVGYSNRAAGKAATEHLIGRGYRHIGFVSSRKADNQRAADRWAGFRAALKSARIAPRVDLELETTLGYGKGAEAVDELMRRERRLQAIFFTGDGWAVGALLHCQRAGIQIPKHLALMGFDDQELTSMTQPQLSSVHVPRYEMGYQAGMLLRQTLNGTPVERSKLDLGFKVVCRGTT